MYLITRGIRLKLTRTRLNQKNQINPKTNDQIEAKEKTQVRSNGYNVKEQNRRFVFFAKK